MIVFENIKKAFKGKQILCGIDGVFEQGKTNFIIGGSGTGKSVLLKAIVGLIPPDEGIVKYDNRDFYNKENMRQIRREIGMLFQGSALFDSKTVEENVRFPLDMLTNMSEKEKQRQVDYSLERVDLEGSNSKMPAELSGGMQKRVGIARAIVLKPKYLFCDEPNSGLDPQTSIKIDQLIQNITHDLNTTTVVVSHDMNSVMGIGEHIMYLKKGHKLWEGSNKTILDTQSKDLQEFIFASDLVKNLKR